VDADPWSFAHDGINPFPSSRRLGDQLFNHVARKITIIAEKYQLVSS
jgi:hypothetical protein